MEYRGYRASVTFSEEDRVFHGRILGIDDVVSFEGSSVEGLEAAFREAVDDYVAFCKEIGKEPERTYSGKFVVRIPPELHRRVDLLAKMKGDSLNAWIIDGLRRLAEEKHV